MRSISTIKKVNAAVLRKAQVSRSKMKNSAWPTMREKRREAGEKGVGKGQSGSHEVIVWLDNG
jgi:hypothetical protein